jgi:hypothetical protein
LGLTIGSRKDFHLKLASAFSIRLEVYWKMEAITSSVRNSWHITQCCHKKTHPAFNIAVKLSEVTALAIPRYITEFPVLLTYISNMVSRSRSVAMGPTICKS